MHWLRPALLYLFVTVLLCGGIWLFWGDAIRQKLKETGENKRSDSASRQANFVKEKTPTPKKLPARGLTAQTQQARPTGKEAWQKASSGFEELLQVATAENRRLLLESVTAQDRRYRTLFFRSVGQRPSAPLAK
jgi:hypothetical protein